MARNDLVYERLYGYQPGGRKPPEFRVFRKMAVKMMDIDHLGKAVVRKLTTIGIQNGLTNYLPYVFFAFHAPGNTRNWPNLSHHLELALQMGRWVLSKSLAVPNYSRELVMPPQDLEPNVDQAMRDLADWCWGDLRNDITTHYIRILKGYQSDFARASNNPNAGASVIAVKNAFEEALDAYPTVFDGGQFLARMIRFTGI